MKNKKTLSVVLFFGFLGLIDGALAGFLEMPDTSEVPGFERETMLKDLDIPSVRERDPDPEAGPRLNVTEFRIQGIVEYPKLDITRKALIRQVEDLRFGLMEEGDMLDSGYTLNELGEVSDLISDIETDTEGEHVGSVDVQRLVFLIREQRRKRGVTLGMIETVADTITRYYRERGFILAKAYIPKQRVRGGIVTLTVLLGELGEVEVVNNKRLSSGTVQRIFKPAMAEPVTSKDIEERLYLVNDLPGVSAQGYFQPGSQVGDTKLSVNVNKESWFSSNIRVDNHGSDSAGKHRIYSDILLHSPFGFSDSLHVEGLVAIDNDATTFGAIKYKTRAIHPRIELQFGSSKNDFVIEESALGGGSNSLQISGESTSTDVSLTYIRKRSRVKNSSLNFKYAEIKSRLVQGVDGSEIVDDTALNSTIGYSFDRLNEKKRMLHIGRVSLTSSEFSTEIQLGDNDARSKNPVIFGFDYSLLTFIGSPFSKKDTRLVINASGQYAGVAMSSITQFGLGGPTRARGFSVSEEFADDAFYSGVEWIFNGPPIGNFVKKNVQPFFLFDLAHGVKHPSSKQVKESAERITLSDVGFGLKLNYRGKLRGNFLAAFPVYKTEEARATSTQAEDDSETTFYADLQYSF